MNDVEEEHHEELIKEHRHEEEKELNHEISVHGVVRVVREVGFNI
jgi:hypothetical protein